MITKQELYNKIQQSEKISVDIKNLTLEEVIKTMFFWNHLTSDNIAGRRLTPTGLFVLSQLYTPYEYGTEKTLLKGVWIIILSKMLKTPWYYGNGKFVLYDKKIYCELKLTGSFSKYMDSAKLKKYQ